MYRNNSYKNQKGHEESSHSIDYGQVINKTYDRIHNKTNNRQNTYDYPDDDIKINKNENMLNLWIKELYYLSTQFILWLQLNYYYNLFIISCILFICSCVLCFHTIYSDYLDYTHTYHHDYSSLENT